MNTELAAAIQQIVAEIPEGCIFDSHLVIALLKQRHPPLYEQHADQFDEANLNSAHGLLAMQIRNTDCERLRVDGLERQTLSINIHNRPSLCACWLRL